MSFGTNLKQLRENLGLTQEEVAEKCGLTTAAISHFERGAREPSLKNAVKIVKGLGCNPRTLIDFD